MNQVRCPQCDATQVTVVDSDETRDVVTIHCVSCGRTSEISGEQFHVDTGDLPEEA